VSTEREPYWLSKKELKALEEHLRTSEDKSEVAEGIRQEVSVATARRDTHRAMNALVIALGLSKGAVPLYLTQQEVNYLKELDTLNPKVKSRLT
jgi:hypothetical protein